MKNILLNKLKEKFLNQMILETIKKSNSDKIKKEDIKIILIKNEIVSFFQTTEEVKQLLEKNYFQSVNDIYNYLFILNNGEEKEKIKEEKIRKEKLVNFKNKNKYFYDRIKVNILCGLPGSGKTTYLEKLKNETYNGFCYEYGYEYIYKKDKGIKEIDKGKNVEIGKKFKLKGDRIYYYDFENKNCSFLVMENGHDIQLYDKDGINGNLKDYKINLTIGDVLKNIKLDENFINEFILKILNFDYNALTKTNKNKKGRDEIDNIKIRLNEIEKDLNYDEKPKTIEFFFDGLMIKTKEDYIKYFNLLKKYINPKNIKFIVLPTSKKECKKRIKKRREQHIGIREILIKKIDNMKETIEVINDIYDDCNCNILKENINLINVDLENKIYQIRKDFNIKYNSRFFYSEYFMSHEGNKLERYEDFDVHYFNNIPHSWEHINKLFNKLNEYINKKNIEKIGEIVEYSFFDPYKEQDDIFLTFKLDICKLDF